MRVELILEAIDRASAPIKAVQAAWSRLEAASSNSSLVKQLQKAQEAAGKAQAEAQTNLVGGVATAGAISAPIADAVKHWNKYEDTLTDVGLKADLSGAKLAELGERVRAQARSLNTSSVDLLKALDRLAAGGLNLQAAETALPAIAKAATGTKAKIEQLSDTVVTLINNMKLLPDEASRALDVLDQAGKEGQFELADIARFFPSLGAQYATLGQTGLKAVADLSAALEVIRGQTGTAEGAATALEDLLNKITLGKARKAFEGLGIDIVSVIEDAKKSGRVIETIIEVLNKATGGDGSKLLDIFQDKQALTGARALLQLGQQFYQIQEKALAARGTVEADFNTRLALGVEQVKALSVAYSELATTVGQVFAPVLAAKVKRITEIVYAIEAWVRANPELVRTIGEIALAVGGALVAVAALRLAFATLRYGLITPIIWLLRLPAAVGAAAGALGFLGRAFLFLFSPIRIAVGAVIGFASGIVGGIGSAIAAVGGWGAAINLFLLRLAGLRVGLSIVASFIVRRVATAFAALGAALLTSPFGLIIAGVAALAAAAYLLYRNWDKVGPWFAALWETIRSTAEAAWSGIIDLLSNVGARALAALKAAWDGLTGFFGDLWSGITSLISGALDGIVAVISSWGGTLGRVFSAVFDPISKIVSGFFAGIGAGFDRVSGVIGSVSNSLFGPSAAGVKATKEQAEAAKAAIDAIAPAAQQAVSAAKAIFAGVSFHDEGVAMMRTLADGIRAGSAAAVAAARETVQQIRDHLPHSPAKVGPLSDLDQVQFGQTLAAAITAGAPTAVLAAQALAASLAATLPSGAASAEGYSSPPAISSRSSAGSDAGSVNGGGNITVNLTLSPNISGGSGDFVAQLKAALPSIGYELAEAIRAELTRRERTQH